MKKSLLIIGVIAVIGVALYFIFVVQPRKDCLNKALGAYQQAAGNFGDPSEQQQAMSNLQAAQSICEQ